MKKMKYLLLTLIIYMATPLYGYADCGIGSLEVEATIENQNGAKIYDKDNNFNGEYLKKGTKVIVEYIYDGYANIRVNDNYIGSVKVGDLSFIKEIIDQEDIHIYYTYEDTKLIEKPIISDSNVIDIIPKGTEIEVHDVKQGSGYGTVNYNGKVGYVYIASCSVEGPVTLFAKKNYENEEEYTLYKDVKYGYKVIGDETTKVEVNLKSKDKIKVKYTTWIGHSSYKYITTDNIEGVWLVDSLFIENKNDFMLKIANREEYIDNGHIEDFNTGKSVNIKFNDEFYNIEYFITGSEEEGYVINKDGKLYALYGSYCNFGEIYYKNKEIIQLENDYEYYKDIFVYPDTKAIGKLEAGSYEAYKYYNIYEYNEICNYYIPGYGYIKFSRKINNSNIENSINKNVKNYVLYVILGTAVVSCLSACLIYSINKIKKEQLNESK